MKYYGLNGEEITLGAWGALTVSDAKVLARTDLPGGVWVSTVLVGIDLSSGAGFPRIFETMVFGPDDMADLDVERYATKEQAMAGHERIVTKWTGWIVGEPYPETEWTECIG